MYAHCKGNVWRSHCFCLCGEYLCACAQINIIEMRSLFAKIVSVRTCKYSEEKKTKPKTRMWLEMTSNAIVNSLVLHTIKGGPFYDKCVEI